MIAQSLTVTQNCLKMNSKEVVLVHDSDSELDAEVEMICNQRPQLLVQDIGRYPSISLSPVEPWFYMRRPSLELEWQRRFESEEDLDGEEEAELDVIWDMRFGPYRPPTPPRPSQLGTDELYPIDVDLEPIMMPDQIATDSPCLELDWLCDGDDYPNTSTPLYFTY